MPVMTDVFCFLAGFPFQLKEVGADCPDSFVQNLDRLILQMHPRFKKKKKKPDNAADGPSNNSANDRDLEKQRRMFPGLSKQDNEPEQIVNKDLLMEEVEDIMLSLEKVLRKSKSRPRMTDEPGD
jgi:ATP-dependent RNA helicase DHX8/PRP22